MGTGLSESIGGAGDDWIEGTDTPASIAIGDDNNLFQIDPVGGDDVGVAGPGDRTSTGGRRRHHGRNGIPTHRFDGMLGFDWVTYRGETVRGRRRHAGHRRRSRSMRRSTSTATAIDLIEGLSGTNFNDLLRGDDRVEADLRRRRADRAWPTGTS